MGWIFRLQESGKVLNIAKPTAPGSWRRCFHCPVHRRGVSNVRLAALGSEPFEGT
jgi:hypothetical protein